MIAELSPDQCERLQEALKGERKAFKILLKTSPHWAAWVNALRGDRKALDWLMKYRYMDLAMFCLACDGEDLAKGYLEKHHGDFLYPFYLACMGRMEGQFWIRHSAKPQMLALSESIAETVKLVTKDKVFWYSSFWS